MKLINTDGMAFIGPGSEWFWTALTGIVLAVTFLAIYRQLSIARSAVAREQLTSFDREWDAERMLRYRLNILVALRDGTDPIQLPEGSMQGVANFWDRTGQLARSGDIDRRVLDESVGHICQAWWRALAPSIGRWRDQDDDPHLYQDFEWLAGYSVERDRRMARSSFDERQFLTLEDRIGHVRELLHVEEALRTVILASPDVATRSLPDAPPAAASPAAI